MADATEDISLNFGEEDATTGRKNIRWVFGTLRGQDWRLQLFCLSNEHRRNFVCDDGDFSPPL